MKGQPKTDAGRLPLVVMMGFSVLLHGLFITGLPNLPWFSRPPDILRLTRYVVRFAKPVPTSVPVLTQVAVAEPVPIEPAPVEPLADLQTPRPIERVETQPEHAVEPLAAPAPVQPVVPKPPDLQQRTASQTRQRVDTQPDHLVKPLVAPAIVQPVVPKPPDVQQRVAAQTRRRVESPTEHVVTPQVAPAVVRPVVPKPPDVQRRVAAQTRRRVESPTEHVVTPQVAPAVVQPVVPKPPDVQRRTAAQTRRRVESPTEHIVTPQVAPTVVQPVVPKPPDVQQRTATRREHVVVQAHQPRPDIMAVEPLPQPVVVKPVLQRRAARAPRSQTATQTTGRQAPSRVAAVVPQTVAPVLSRAVALPQPREPSPAAILQAQAEQERLLDEQEQTAIQSYTGLVFQKLESHKRYPRAAERRELSGRVVLRFTVRWDGEVLDPEVVEVDGHHSFRDAALLALKRVGQLPRFPDEIRRRELLVEVPITYKIDGR